QSRDSAFCLIGRTWKYRKRVVQRGQINILLTRMMCAIPKSIRPCSANYSTVYLSPDCSSITVVPGSVIFLINSMAGVSRLSQSSYM
ncbi:MAG: hypothetical protein KGL95_07420, partial [Patescibacteria group bacterium]|nr:hypothetical protein [Patescibacteria group bacterium]